MPAKRIDPLRDEAIASLALPDLRPTGRVIHRPSGAFDVAFDPTMTRYALLFRDGTIQVRLVADDLELVRFRREAIESSSSSASVLTGATWRPGILKAMP